MVTSPLMRWMEIKDVQSIYIDELEEVIATLPAMILQRIRPLDVLIFKHW